MKRTKRVLREAADLLACCASQRESWPWFMDELGASKEAVEVANEAWDGSQFGDGTYWRECYAEAEARLREEIANMGGKRR